MKAIVNLTSWFEGGCPHCGAKNWVYGGDPSDITFFREEAIRCWKCDSPMWLDDGEEESEPECLGRGVRMERVK